MYAYNYAYLQECDKLSFTDGEQLAPSLVRIHVNLYDY